MIKSILKALGLTISVVLSIVLLIAMLYVTMWFVAGMAIVLLFLSIYYLLQAKDRI